MPRFYQARLTEIRGNVLEYVYRNNPRAHQNTTLDERLPNGVCQECGADEWWILPEESVAVKEGGKPYIECLSCGFKTHL